MCFRISILLYNSKLLFNYERLMYLIKLTNTGHIELENFTTVN